MKHNSIAERLRWSFLISSMLPLLIVGIFLVYLNLREQQNRVYSEQYYRSQQVAHDIDVAISTLSTDLEGYSLVFQEDQPFEQKVQDAEDFVTMPGSGLISLIALDHVGKELFHVTATKRLPADQLRDRSADPIISAALRFGKIHYTPISLSSAGTPVFGMTIPVRNENNGIIGVLQAEIDASHILQGIGNVDNESQILALLINEETGQIMLPSTATPTSAAQLFSLMKREESIGEYIRTDSIAAIGAMSPVIISEQGQKTGWWVLIEQPIDIAFRNIRQSVGILTMFVIVTGVLAFLLAFWQSNRLLKPLTELREGAHMLGSGQLEYRTTYQGNDELGDVAYAFNQMADQLQISQEKIARQNEHLRHGMVLARDLQLGLLPQEAPWDSERIHVHARSIPAYEVGGDFYTYLALPDDRIAIAIGDISGKGVSAALMMALVSSAIEAQEQHITGPAQILHTLNRLLLPRLQANHMNAALLFMIIDPQTSLVKIANAGMIAPILMTPHGTQLIDVGGLPLGSYSKAQYIDHEVQLSHGDIILLVSDGIIEAHNLEGTMFGFERLDGVLSSQAHITIKALVDHVLTEVHAFIGQAEQHDDMTIVAVQF